MLFDLIKLLCLSFPQIADGFDERHKLRLLFREPDDLVRRGSAVEARLDLGRAPQDQVKLVGGEFQGKVREVKPSSQDVAAVSMNESGLG